MVGAARFVIVITGRMWIVRIISLTDCEIEQRPRHLIDMYLCMREHSNLTSIS